MALGRQVVDLVGLDLLNYADEVGGVGQITVVQFEAYVFLVRILIQVVDAIGIEGRRSAFDAVNVVAFGEQKFGQIGSVLPRNTGN